jgi:Ca2+-binding EF-hand superfamily protein
VRERWSVFECIDADDHKPYRGKNILSDTEERILVTALAEARRNHGAKPFVLPFASAIVSRMDARVMLQNLFYLSRLWCVFHSPPLEIEGSQNGPGISSSTCNDFPPDPDHLDECNNKDFISVEQFHCCLKLFGMTLEEGEVKRALEVINAKQKDNGPRTVDYQNICKWFASKRAPLSGATKIISRAPKTGVRVLRRRRTKARQNSGKTSSTKRECKSRADFTLDKLLEKLRRQSLVKAVWNAMDSDGSRTINRSEFRSGLSMLGFDVSSIHEDELTSLFKHFDIDSDGEITWNEMKESLRPKSLDQQSKPLVRKRLIAAQLLDSTQNQAEESLEDLVASLDSDPLSAAKIIERGRRVRLAQVRGEEQKTNEGDERKCQNISSRNNLPVRKRKRRRRRKANHGRKIGRGLPQLRLWDSSPRSMSPRSMSPRSPRRNVLPRQSVHETEDDQFTLPDEIKLGRESKLRPITRGRAGGFPPIKTGSRDPAQRYSSIGEPSYSPRRSRIAQTKNNQRAYITELRQNMAKQLESALLKAQLQEVRRNQRIQQAKTRSEKRRLRRKFAQERAVAEDRIACLIKIINSGSTSAAPKRESTKMSWQKKGLYGGGDGSKDEADFLRRLKKRQEKQRKYGADVESYSESDTD